MRHLTSLPASSLSCSAALLVSILVIASFVAPCSAIIPDISHCIILSRFLDANVTLAHWPPHSECYNLNPTRYCSLIEQVLHQVRISHDIHLPQSIHFFEQDYREYCTRINASNERGKTGERNCRRRKPNDSLLKTTQLFNDLHV